MKKISLSQKTRDIRELSNIESFQQKYVICAVINSILITLAITATNNSLWLVVIGLSILSAGSSVYYTARLFNENQLKDHNNKENTNA